jgi:hypothetical protein
LGKFAIVMVKKYSCHLVSFFWLKGFYYSKGLSNYTWPLHS